MNKVKIEVYSRAGNTVFPICYKAVRYDVRTKIVQRVKVPIATTVLWQVAGKIHECLNRVDKL